MIALNPQVHATRKDASLRLLLYVCVAVVCFLLGIMAGHLLFATDAELLLMETESAFDARKLHFARRHFNNRPRPFLPNYKFERPLSRLARKTHNPRMPYELTPNTDIRIAGIRYRINRYGYRGRPVSPADTCASPIIGFFGGSAVFGEGLPEQETIPAILEHRLTDRFRVLNMGIFWSNLITDIERYKYFKALGYHFNIIIFYWTEFAFDPPGMIWVTDRWPLNGTHHIRKDIRIKLVETIFDGIHFHYDHGTSTYFTNELVGIHNAELAIRTLATESARVIVVIDDPYDVDRRGSYNHRVFQLIRMLRSMSTKAGPIVAFPTWHIDRTIRSKKLFIDQLSLVPVCSKRLLLAEALAHRILGRLQ